MSEVAIRVMLVDDHAILREGLAAALPAHGIDVVAQVGGGTEALAAYVETAPDVSVVDLRMSPMDGADLISGLKQHDPDARVVLLTTYDTDEDIFRGLRAGASSYVLKSVGVASLVETIRAVRSGKRVIAPAIASKLAEHVAADALTPRQTEVLRCLSEGKSNAEVADSLCISEGTVKAHVKAILGKLDARDRTQALMTAFRRGLLRPT
jgi:two-component system, NarL family, response regulator